MPYRPRTASSSRRFRFTSHTSALVIALLVLVTGAISARAWLSPSASTRYQQAAATPTATPTTKATPNPNYVRRPLVSPQLMFALNALGNRLEKPGQERLTLLGTITRPEQSKNASPVRLILEYPDRLRLEEQSGSLVKITLVGENGASKLGGPLQEQDADETESLLLDSADHFFAGRMKGFAMRNLGQRFRPDGGITKNYTGPLYDAYQMHDLVALTLAARMQPKSYHFNSQTQLLDHVRYDLKRGGRVIKVETQISGWQKTSAQQLPRTITRLENGQPTLVLNITAASVSQHLNDNIFIRP